MIWLLRLKKEDAKMKRLSAVGLLLLLCIAAVPAQVLASTYSGFLTAGGGGLTATEQWNSTSTKLSWDITGSGTSWSYSYTFIVPAKNISHFIIQVTDGASQGDFSAGLLDLYSSSSQGNSNPGMPKPLYGLKFNGSALSLTVFFTSTHAPVYGDFYAKDGTSSGNPVYAYNDSTHQILRPDGTGISPVPIPPTVWLLGSGLVGLIGLKRKFIG
jgi:hypothetical protein